jgi:hypothetical protein
MTGSSVVGEDVEKGLESLVEHLRDGPLKSLILLQGRAESVTTEPLSGEELIEELESLVSLMLSAMVRFHEFNAELQRLVDRLACELREQPAEELPDLSRLS